MVYLCDKMKGDFLISHVLFISIGLLALMLILSSFFVFGGDFKERYKEAISQNILSKIERDVYGFCKDEFDFSVLYEDIPEKISDKRYLIGLDGTEIYLEIGSERYSRNLDIGCVLSGRIQPPLGLSYNKSENTIKVFEWEVK